MKSTRKSLWASGLALLVCVALLIGTTFAWFTDSVTNTGNRIQAGSLNVELLKAGTDRYENISGGTGDIFSGGNWEPNKTQIVYLAIQNNGTLAASVDFTVINADNSKLGDVLQLALIDDVDPTNPITAENWDKLIAGLDSGVNYFKKLSDSRTPIQDRVLNAGDTMYFALAVHMDKNAGDEYQNVACTIDVLVHADQATVEDDAFGNDYDADAAYSIDTNQELKDALSHPIDGVTYVVNADNLTVPSVSAGEDAKFTIDLNGHTVTLTGNTGYKLNKAKIHLTLTDTSDGRGGKLLHTGDGYLAVGTRDQDDTIEGQAFAVSEGKGLTDGSVIIK